MRYKEKEIKKYVIADLSNQTNYIFSKRNGKYSLIDNIAAATKFVNKGLAELICNECTRCCNVDLVVVPVIITYEIAEE